MLGGGVTLHGVRPICIGLWLNVLFLSHVFVI